MKNGILDSEKLKQARKNENLSVEKLAEKLHIAVSTVRAYERGEREPSDEGLVDIAAVLRVAPEELLMRKPKLYSIGGAGFKINETALDISRLVQFLQLDGIANDYQAFLTYLESECEPYWAALKNRQQSSEEAILPQTSIYRYTKKNSCKKVDFYRVLEILNALENWDDPSLLTKTAVEPKLGLQWLLRFSCHICEIAEMMKESKTNDTTILNNVVSFFAELPSTYEKALNDDDDIDDTFTQEEWDVEIQGIWREWKMMSVLNQFIISDMLYFAFIHRKGYRAYLATQRYGCLPTESKNIIMAYIINKATSEQRQQFDGISAILHECEKVTRSNKRDWVRLLEALEFNDRAILDFKSSKTADTDTLKLFHHLLIYYELEKSGTMKNLISTLDVLLEGQWLLAFQEADM